VIQEEIHPILHCELLHVRSEGIFHTIFLLVGLERDPPVEYPLGQIAVVGVETVVAEVEIVGMPGEGVK
jgi:hypothetical protein